METVLLHVYVFELQPPLFFFSSVLGSRKFNHIWSRRPPWFLCWQKKQSYSDNDSFFGLLCRAEQPLDCWFGSGMSVMVMSVKSGLCVGDCVESEDWVESIAEFWSRFGASICVWREATTGGRSLGLRPLFLPVVAPFLTSSLMPP